MKTAWTLLKETVNAWLADRCDRLGAALAYYSVFSIAPILIIAIALAGAIFGDKAARGQIAQQISETVGPSAAQAIEDILKGVNSPGGNFLATVIGLAALLFGASGVFIALQDSLNTVWKVTTKPGRTIRRIVRERLLSFSVVLGTGFLLLISLVISAALAALSAWLTPESMPGGVYLWQGINFVVSLTFNTVLFGLIFKLLPDVQLGWRDVWVGALVTALLFSLGKFLIGLYLGQAGIGSAYGAAGSLVIILLWVYYSSQILMFGAEFTRVWTRWRGVDIRPTANATLLSCEQRIDQGLPPDGDGAVQGPHTRVHAH